MGRKFSSSLGSSSPDVRNGGHLLPPFSHNGDAAHRVKGHTKMRWLKWSTPFVFSLCLFSFLLGSFLGGTFLAIPPGVELQSRLGMRGMQGSFSKGVHEVNSLRENEAGKAEQESVQGKREQGKRSHRVIADVGTHQATITSSTSKASTSASTSAVLLEPGKSGERALTEAPFQVLSWNPRVFFFPDFLDSDRCDAIVRKAKGSLSPSGLALRPGDLEEDSKDVRTSSGTFLGSSDDPSGALAFVERKMANAAMLPVAFGEAFNVLRYNIGQKYDAHADYFDPKDYGPQESQRIATFLLYLTDVEEGGETMFPYEGGRNLEGEFDFTKCIGLTVPPKKGAAILFWSILPNGTLDNSSVHGSCPVIRGEKWVATKWIRNWDG